MRAIAEADADPVRGRRPCRAVTPLDRELASQLRRPASPIVPARSTRSTRPTRDDLSTSSTSSASGEPYAVSAAHGRGVDELLEAIVASPCRAPAPVADEPLRRRRRGWPARRRARRRATDRPEAAARRSGVAFVGKPNAGKSSLLNRLLGEERSLVHDVARHHDRSGRHRRSTFGGRHYVLVDTAGHPPQGADRRGHREARGDDGAGPDRARRRGRAGDRRRSAGPSEQDARLAGHGRGGRPRPGDRAQQVRPAGRRRRQARRCASATTDDAPLPDLGAARCCLRAARRRRRSA